MIARFNDILTKEGLEDKVELKGTFCMERCGEGINWQINDEVFSSSSVEDGVGMFQKEVLGLLRGKTSEQHTKEPG
jgi:NADH-quinone oxidoreductase subunit G